MEIEIESNVNKIENTKKIFSIYHTIKKPYIMPKAEARIKNDLEVFKTKRLISNKYLINISPYSQSENGKDFIMNIEFINLFKIQIIFLEDYPFVPPIIKYISGKFYDNLFNIDNTLNINCLRKEKWSPCLDLNSIFYSIELKLDEINTFFSKEKTRKRNYFEYQKIHNIPDIIVPFHQFKKLKIY